MAASKPNATTDALQLLDELDIAGGNAAGKAPAGAPIEGDAAEALAFLDELTQKPAAGSTLERKQSTPLLRPSSRASLQAPTGRRSIESTRAAIAAARSGSPAPERAATPSPAPPPSTAQQQQQAGGPGGWGWGSVWSAATAARTAATAAVAQARTVVDEQVKHLPNVPINNEQARKWGEGMMEYVKQAQLDKITQDLRDRGIATFTDILNVVAPPISEHEVIQVWLSHDMEGYEGVENLVYRALARIMEQVEGGDLVVNKGNESRPKESADGERDLNAVDGQDAALKLAKANIDDLAKSKAAETEKSVPESSLQNPTTYSHVYLRIQPFFLSHPFAAQPASAESSEPPVPARHLHFLLHLHDPSHNLEHTTVSQALPEKWLELWDEYEWVEDLVAESLRVSVEVIGQEYVVERMGWKKGAKAEAGIDVKGKGKESSSDEEPVNIHVPL